MDYYWFQIFLQFLATGFKDRFKGVSWSTAIYFQVGLIFWDCSEAKMHEPYL